jgi:hypothetical protein
VSITCSRFLIRRRRVHVPRPILVSGTRMENGRNTHVRFIADAALAFARLAQLNPGTLQ